MNEDLMVDVMAVHRLTRLVTADTITRPLRVRIIRWAYRKPRSTEVSQPVRWSEATWDQMPHDDDDAPKLAAFIVCPWCVGLWISGFVVVARRYAGVLWRPLARALALSTGAALIAGHEADQS